MTATTREINSSTSLMKKYEGKLNIVFQKKIVTVEPKSKPKWELNQYIEPILEGWNKNKYLPLLKKA